MSSVPDRYVTVVCQRVTSGCATQVAWVKMEVSMPRNDLSVFVHDDRLLILPNARASCCHVCVLYPESGRYQLYAIDDSGSKVPYSLSCKCPQHRLCGKCPQYRLCGKCAQAPCAGATCRSIPRLRASMCRGEGHARLAQCRAQGSSSSTCLCGCSACLCGCGVALVPFLLRHFAVPLVVLLRVLPSCACILAPRACGSGELQASSW
jgi:hypothetical protein